MRIFSFNCMPHVCGDEPKEMVFSVPELEAVCPTYVGMNHRIRRFFIFFKGMPHVCGDEPLQQAQPGKLKVYAPRMWG